MLSRAVLYSECSRPHSSSTEWVSQACQKVCISRQGRESLAVDIFFALQTWQPCRGEVFNGMAPSLGAMHQDRQVFNAALTVTMILMPDDSFQEVNGWFWCISAGLSFEIWRGRLGWFTGIALLSSAETAVGALGASLRASKESFHCSLGMLHLELCLSLYQRQKLWWFLEAISQRFC